MQPVLCTSPSRLTMERQAGSVGWMRKVFTSCTSLMRQQRRTSRLVFLATTMMLILVLQPAQCRASSAAEADHGEDVACLKEFKESVTDPLRYLKNWDFRGSRVDICNFVGVTCLRRDEPKVHALDLAAAGLRGRFPRGLGKCSSLTELNLSNNFFTGRIPPTICSSNPKLTKLDLSNNAFSGPVPARFARSGGCRTEEIRPRMEDGIESRTNSKAEQSKGAERADGTMTADSNVKLKSRFEDEALEMDEAREEI